MFRRHFGLTYRTRITTVLFTSLSLMFLLATGCARQSFQSDPSKTSTPGTPPAPTPNQPQSISKTIGGGKVDILLINDNSGSMAINQSRLSTAFGSFVSALAGRDWRIGMTTTDIYSTDGRLVPFGGYSYLTSSTPNASSLFSSGVYRPETVACEQSGYVSSSCPSFDERGTYAAYRALNRNEGSWLRSDAVTAVIFLANEDVRSDSSIYNSIAGYSLETNDRPDAMISLFNSGSMYGGKILQAHSIIVVPGDEGCRQAQTVGPAPGQPKGFFGRIYRDASDLTVGRGWGGSVSSICATDYSSIIANIGVQVRDSDRMMQLPCVPKNSLVQVTLQPANAGVSASYNPSTNSVSVSSNIPSGTIWTATFTCQ